MSNPLTVEDASVKTALISLLIGTFALSKPIAKSLMTEPGLKDTTVKVLKEVNVA